jgi:hypothetical protein
MTFTDTTLQSIMGRATVRAAGQAQVAGIVARTILILRRGASIFGAAARRFD